MKLDHTAAIFGHSCGALGSQWMVYTFHLLFMDIAAYLLMVVVASCSLMAVSLVSSCDVSRALCRSVILPFVLPRHTLEAKRRQYMPTASRCCRGPSSTLGFTWQGRAWPLAA